MKISNLIILPLSLSLTLAATVSCTDSRKGARGSGIPASAASAGIDSSVSSAAEDSIATSADGSGVHSREGLKARVEKIYRHIASVYNECDNTEEMSLAPLEKVDFDKLYCTDEWNNTQDEISRIDSRYDDIGYFSFDYWINGQDFKDVRFTGVKVLQYEGNHGFVKLNLFNMGRMTDVRLEMNYERGNWYINDINLEDSGKTFTKSTSMLTGMKRYVRDESKKNK